VKRKSGAVPFTSDDYEAEAAAAAKRQKMSLLDQEIRQQKEKQEALERAQRLIAQVPKDLESVYAYVIEWPLLESKNIVEEKMRPWTVKKVKVLISQDDPVLVDFVIDNLNKKLTPQRFLEELTEVLDEDAKGFVLECWRRLIFEQLDLKERLAKA
jgi:hypothetical protein